MNEKRLPIFDNVFTDTDEAIKDAYLVDADKFEDLERRVMAVVGDAHAASATIYALLDENLSDDARKGAMLVYGLLQKSLAALEGE